MHPKTPKSSVPPNKLPPSASQTRFADPTGEQHLWAIAAEVPVELGFNGNPWTVMLATPADLEDMALGLAYSEGVISDPTAITGADIAHYPEGVTIDVGIPETALNQNALSRARSLEGRTGCGLCGVERLTDIARPMGKLASSTFSGEAVIAGFRKLGDALPLSRQTRSVHGAAWLHAGGNIGPVREDVGRHNALDKLIGALLKEGVDPTSGAILMTSRCSFELVQKTTRFGCPTLATLSAPTSMALSLAAQAGLRLYARGPAGVALIPLPKDK